MGLPCLVYPEVPPGPPELQCHCRLRAGVCAEHHRLAKPVALLPDSTRTRVRPAGGFVEGLLWRISFAGKKCN